MFEIKDKKKFFEDLQYLALIFGLAAQVVLGKQYFLGQGLYLIGYSISAFRTIVLERPTADKIMEFSNLGLTIGLFILGFFIFWKKLKKNKKFLKKCWQIINKVVYLYCQWEIGRKW